MTTELEREHLEWFWWFRVKVRAERYLERLDDEPTDEEST